MYLLSSLLLGCDFMKILQIDGLKKIAYLQILISNPQKTAFIEKYLKILGKWMDLNGWKKLESTKYLSFHSGGCHQGHGGSTHKFRLVSVGCRRRSNRVITSCPLFLSFLMSISVPLHKHYTKCNSR